MKIAPICMSLILLMGTVVWPATALSFAKGEKDVNVNGDKFNEVEDYQVQKKPIIPKHPPEPLGDTKETKESRAETNQQLSEPKEVKGETTNTETKIPLPEKSVRKKTEDEAENEEDGDDSESEPSEEEADNGEEPTIFALANTDVGRDWEGIPFREKYLWGSRNGLCRHFQLSVPHEASVNGELTICLYRREMSRNPATNLLLIPEISEYIEGRSSVYGYVEGYPKSSVVGNLHKGHFFGVISLGRSPTGLHSDYVVENVNVLVNLMNQSPKLLRNLQMVMESAMQGQKGSPNLDAIVTTGTSLQHFMAPDKFLDNAKGTIPFLSLSTGHNSFIISGEPTMRIDGKGRTVFSTGHKVLTIGTDSSVTLSLKSKDKEYIFHPNGKSILKEGLNMTDLAEHEGPVAVSAVSSKFQYGCLIPSPAFSKKRKGGFVCKVCIGLDESFRTKYRIPNNVTEMDSYEFLGNTVDKVSWIFRSVDWDGDGSSDDIGISYDAEFFHWDYADDGIENLSAEDLERFYGELVKLDFAECCLALAYTMKRFPGDIFAKASPAKPVAESGICAAKEQDGAANNAIIISGNSKQSPFSSMNPDQLVYVTAHEIGKAFGGSLDGDGDTKCDSFQDAKGVKRHFLLWPDVGRRDVTNQEKVFSHCSIGSIQKVLNSCRSSCFDIQPDPFCGNGIVEIGEECDCGSEIGCAAQHCCFSRNGKYPCQRTGHECPGGSGSVNQVGFAPLTLATISLAARYSCY